MRTRTVAALVLLVLALAAAGGAALWTLPGGGDGALSEVWISDTARDNEFNHHGVGAADGVVVAPVTGLQGQDGLTRRSCSLERLDADDGSVRWWVGVRPERCFSHAWTKPTVADLTGDGRPEVVAGTTENATVAYAADGRELFRIPTRAYGYPRPTVADVLGDEAPEIVASDISGDVFVADAEGAVRWRGNVSGIVYASPVVADLDGDDGRDVVVAGREETVAYDADGTVLWRRDVGANDAETAAVDGESVVVVAGNDGVVALDGATGERRWNRSADGSPAMGALADGDGDGAPEAYVSEAGNVLRALDAADGSEQWRTRLATSEGAVTPPAVLGDPDGDGSPELIAATNGGTVAVLDPATGAERAAYERDVPVWTGVTPANLTAAPGDELLVRYGDGRVVALEYRG